METRNWIYVSVLAVVVTADAWGQQPVKPVRSELQYIPQEIKYLGSKNPVPDQHVKCLIHMDNYLDRAFARLNRHTNRDGDWSRAVKANEGLSRKTDWGISRSINYPEWEGELRAKLPVARKELQEARAELKEFEEELRQMMLKAAAMTQGPARVTMLSAVAVGHSAVQSAREVVLYSEDAVDSRESMISYTQCVSANGLPPTIP